MRVFVEELGKKVSLPDFFVVGAPKCGTTSLYEMLRQADDIFLPDLKEPNYFAYYNRPCVYKLDSPSGTYDKFITGFDDYVALYSVAGEKLAGDFSTHHLRFSKRFIERIGAVYGPEKRKVRIVVLQRDPAEIAYSLYMMRHRDGFESLSFLKAIDPETIKRRLDQGYLPSYDYLRFSAYQKDLAYLSAHFKHVAVFQFEDMVKNSRGTLMQIADFIGVEDREFIDEHHFPKANVSGKAGKGWLNRFMFRLFFRKGGIKKLLPKSWRRQLEKKVKQQVGRLFLEKPNMTEEELTTVRKLIESY